MSIITTVEARDRFSDLLNRAAYGKERVILTRRGKELVAVVPLEDLELLEAIEEVIDLQDARKALEEPGSVTLEDLKQELGL